MLPKRSFCPVVHQSLLLERRKAERPLYYRQTGIMAPPPDSQLPHRRHNHLQLQLRYRHPPGNLWRRYQSGTPTAAL